MSSYVWIFGLTLYIVPLRSSHQVHVQIGYIIIPSIETNSLINQIHYRINPSIDLDSARNHTVRIMNLSTGSNPEEKQIEYQHPTSFHSSLHLSHRWYRINQISISNKIVHQTECKSNTDQTRTSSRFNSLLKVYRLQPVSLDCHLNMFNPKCSQLPTS